MTQKASLPSYSLPTPHCTFHTFAVSSGLTAVISSDSSTANIPLFTFRLNLSNNPLPPPALPEPHPALLLFREMIGLSLLPLTVLVSTGLDREDAFAAAIRADLITEDFLAPTPARLLLLGFIDRLSEDEFTAPTSGLMKSKRER